MADVVNLNEIPIIKGVERLNIKTNDMPEILEKRISYFIYGKTAEFFSRFNKKRSVDLGTQRFISEWVAIGQIMKSL